MTTVQKLAVRLAGRSGRLIRSRGGYWHAPETPMTGRGSPETWVGTHTIKALEKKGVFELVALRPGWFSVEARLIHKCSVFGCDNFHLIWVLAGETVVTPEHGIHTAKVEGWYCPRCMAGYGGGEANGSLRRLETILARTEAKAIRGEELQDLRETKGTEDE